jgi:hypothetical protein
VDPLFIAGRLGKGADAIGPGYRSANACAFFHNHRKAIDLHQTAAPAAVFP